MKDNIHLVVLNSRFTPWRGFLRVSTTVRRDVSRTSDGLPNRAFPQSKQHRQDKRHGRRERAGKEEAASENRNGARPLPPQASLHEQSATSFTFDVLSFRCPLAG